MVDFDWIKIGDLTLELLSEAKGVFTFQASGLVSWKFPVTYSHSVDCLALPPQFGSLCQTLLPKIREFCKNYKAKGLEK